MWQYLQDRYQRLCSRFGYSVGILSVAIAIVGFVMRRFMPDLSLILETTLWGGGLTILTGLVAVIFLLSLTKRGRKVIETFPWERGK